MAGKYKNRYEVTDEKSCRDLRTIPMFSRYALDADGNIYSKNYKNGGKLVRLTPAKKTGYYQTMLLGDDGKYHSKCIHRLMMLTFVGPRNGMEIDHINGVKTDNRIENLEYVSHSENIKRAFRLGLEKPMRGESNPTAKLSDAEVAEIREYVMSARAKGIRFYGRKELAQRYGISEYYIKDLVSRRRGARSF